MVTRSLSSSRSSVLQLRARQMRSHLTPSEAALFRLIGGGRLGVTFRRQVVLGERFIADFLVPQMKLVLEVDGGCHRDRRAADASRDRTLERLGYRVRRLQAEVVLREPEAALAVLTQAVEQPCTVMQRAMPLHRQP